MNTEELQTLKHIILWRENAIEALRNLLAAAEESTTQLETFVEQLEEHDPGKVCVKMEEIAFPTEARRGRKKSTEFIPRSSSREVRVSDLKDAMAKYNPKDFTGLNFEDCMTLISENGIHINKNEYNESVILMKDVYRLKETFHF